jgi:glycosyltransferase involved in cell wall biosynthesis
LPTRGSSGDPLLSICIATFKRGAYIGATLQSILDGLPESVEVVILDGASPDNTREVVERFTRGNSAVRYIRESVNSGVDADFDKAVRAARGTFCWLMSDDDILVPGAVERVLARLEPTLDLMVVNPQVRNDDLSVVLTPRMLDVAEDRFYDLKSADSFLADTGACLAYVGAVVIRRSRWMERDRERYFGSLFVHVGVIFQAPLPRIRVLAEPLIWLRAGNSMWTSRGFEIWMFLWPNLIWSFDGFSADAKAAVVPREPWRGWRQLTMFRAIGAYSYEGYLRFFKAAGRGGILQLIVSVLPGAPANAAIAVYYYFANRKARTGIYDLVKSRNSCGPTRLVARMLGIPTR